MACWHVTILWDLSPECSTELTLGTECGSWPWIDDKAVDDLTHCQPETEWGSAGHSMDLWPSSQWQNWTDDHVVQECVRQKSLPSYCTFPCGIDKNANLYSNATIGLNFSNTVIFCVNDCNPQHDHVYVIHIVHSQTDKYTNAYLSRVKTLQLWQRKDLY